MKTTVSVATQQFLGVIVKVSVIIAFLYALASCQQDYEIPVKAEKVKIFVSSLPKGELKSAALNESKVEIAQGDTAWFPRNVNSLMWAIKESGLPASGAWKIEMIKTDIMILFQESSGYNPIERYRSYFGDQIIHQFPEVGLYRISFGQLTDANQMAEEFFFFVRISDYPGKVGDEVDNDYIFRMESKTVINTSTYELENLIYIYFKFSSGPNMDPEKAYCRLTDLRKNGTEISGMVHLIKWQFARDYYYLVIPPDNKSMRRYRAVFMVSDTQGFNGYSDRNNYRSSLWGKYGIEFAVQ